MNLVPTSVTIALLTAAPIALCEDDGIKEIVLRHWNWDYPAFFLAAPNGTKGSMAPAIHRFCSATADAQEKLELLWLDDEHSPEYVAAAKKWDPSIEIYSICEVGDLSYFVGMTGQVEMTKWGYVCAGTPGLEEQKYYAEFMLRDWANCIVISWDEEAKIHVLEVPGDA